MWKEHVVDLLCDISDFLEVLREMSGVTTGVFSDRARTKYDSEIAQICHLIYMFKS